MFAHTEKYFKLKNDDDFVRHKTYPDEKKAPVYYITIPARGDAYTTPAQLLFLCLLSDGKGHTRRDASNALSIDEKTLRDDVINPLLRLGYIIQESRGIEKPYCITTPPRIKSGVHAVLADLRHTIPAYEQWASEAPKAIEETIANHRSEDNAFLEDLHNFILLYRKLSDDHCPESEKKRLNDEIKQLNRKIENSSEYDIQLGRYSKPGGWQKSEWEIRRSKLIKGTNLERLLRKNPGRINKQRNDKLLDDIQRHPSKYINRTLKFYKASRKNLKRLAPPSPAWNHLFRAPAPLPPPS